MARGIFGRQRANTAVETISRPTLTFTDAAPRDDLQALGQISAANLQPVAYGGWPLKQGTPNDVHAFDFRVTEPPEEAVQSVKPGNEMTDDALIGIALGSPSVVASPYTTAKWKDGPVVSGWQETVNQTSDSLRRKPSKWKKFGGIFKGKQNLPKPSNLPFYQVQINGQPLQASPDLLSQEIFPAQTRRGFQQEPARPDKGSNHIEAWPKVEDDSPLDERFRKEQARDNGNHPRTEPNGRVNSIESETRGPAPLLHVDIPEIQMERYSVMFGSVLGNKQPQGLLARRSKTLDKLKVSTEDPNKLQAHKPQRRATSPSLSKSPYFTLFPNHDANQASSGAGSRVLPYRRPQRSQTAPVEPMKTMRSKDRVHLLVPNGASRTPSATSQGQPGPSYASPASVASSGDQSIEVTLRHKPIKSYVDEKKEPAWDMLTTAAKRTDSPESMTESSSSASAVSSKSSPATPEEIPPMTPPKDYPPTAGQIAASLYATREKVERVMSPPVSSSSRSRSQSATRAAATSSVKTRKGSRSGSRSGTSNHRVSPKAATPAASTTLSPVETPTPVTPSVEVSIARSVSVSRSRGPRQALVPLGAGPEEFEMANERLVERQPLVPTVVDVRRGHRPGKSQNVLIETVSALP